jgi:C-terminal processing protease CtpA/Prc
MVLTAKTNDDELFGIMTSMLRHLNDNHVELLCKEPKRLSRSGYLGLLIDEMGTKAIELISKRPVPAKVFISPPKLSENKIFLYGKLDEKIGYFHFGKVFDMEGSTKAIDNIVKEFADMDAIIIDARLNIGGIDLITQAMVGRFADKKLLFMTTQQRNGAKHTDCTKKKEWYVEPQGAKQFTKKVILLTDRTTISSGENFALAMKVLPHASVVGDFTSGCFADIRHLLLPNGWHIAIPFNLFKDSLMIGLKRAGGSA